MRTAFDLPGPMRTGDYYARRDCVGVHHLVRFGGSHGQPMCVWTGGLERLVFNEPGCVSEVPTCLTCIAISC